MIQLEGSSDLYRMSTVSLIEQYLWWMATAGYAVLYLRVFRLGLHRIYRWFGFYLLFRLLRSVALMVLPHVGVARSADFPGFALRFTSFSDNAYGWIWVFTLPVLEILYVLMVLELVSLILEKFRGIASLGRWAVLGGLAFGVLIAAMTLAPDLSNPAEQYPLLRYFGVLERGITSSLVLFLLFIAGFLVWYPVPLSRNLLAHSIIYTAYFLFTSAAIFIRNLSAGQAILITNVTLSGASFACILAWLFVLNRKGEIRAVTIRQRWDAKQQAQLIDQLATINASLLRAVRK